MWNGPQFRNLLLSVDLVLGMVLSGYYSNEVYITSYDYIAIFKRNRHYYETLPRSVKRFLLSGSHVEKTFINSLPLNAKRGLILAKAVRITSIAKPDRDLNRTFCLSEDIAIDDLITSHLLKSCLVIMTLKKTNNPRVHVAASDFSVFNTRTPIDWALVMYKELERQLEAKQVRSWVDQYGTGIVDCTNCKVEHGCCMKQKLMLAMTRKILQWLKDNQADLQDIDYGDDTRNDDRCFKTTVYQRSYLRSTWYIGNRDDAESRFNAKWRFYTSNEN